MWPLPRLAGAIDGLGGRATSLHLSSCPLVAELSLHCGLWRTTEAEGSRGCASPALRHALFPGRSRGWGSLKTAHSCRQLVELKV